ncbi:MAG: CinA family nicotinamide mononucleotide deamidase-related protein [Planctomycetota bacterium]
MIPTSTSFSDGEALPKGPRIEILAIGSELLSGRRYDRNSSSAQRLLRAVGLRVERVTVVADGREAVAAALRELTARCDLVLVSGGLGPTPDNGTREALAEASGFVLEENAEAVAWQRLCFERAGREPGAAAKRQTWLPSGSRALVNALGTTPGIDVSVGSCRVFCLPGVPAEFERMLEDEVLPRVCGLGVATASVQRRIHVVCQPESAVAEKVAPLLEGRGSVEIGFTVDWGTACITLESHVANSQEVERLERAILTLFGDAVYGTGDVSLAEVAGRLLIETNTTLAVAESCTGGRLAARLTGIPGISRVFLEGCVAYSDDAKVRTLEVPRTLIDTRGAVSREVAEAMATGIAARAGSDLGIGITGIAGPGGGSAEKPVGLVYLSLFDRGDVKVWELRLEGDRTAIQERATISALDMIRRSRWG